MHMKLFWRLFPLIVLLIGLLSPTCFGFSSKKTAQDLGEAIAKKFGNKGSQEFAAFGGEFAVESLLKKATAEGGEELVAKVVKYGSEYGVQGLKVIRRSPVKMVQALERLPPGRVKEALWAVERDPERVTKLVASTGPEAMSCLIKHPGLGVEFLEKFGADGVRLSKQLSTEQVGSLLKYSDDIVKLPKSTRDGVIDAIGKNSAASLQFLEKHPKVLATGAGVSAFILLREDLLGANIDSRPRDEPGKPPLPKGWIERVLERIMNTFRTPISVIFLAVAALVLGWGGVHVWTKWRIAKLKIEKER